MKPTIDEHASRFDRMAADYDAMERPVYAACRDLVISAADPTANETVLDLGTGTGAIAIALATHAGRVIGRDISDAMLEEARSKAKAQGLKNVEFGNGRFRSPQVEEPVDIVTTNYAMHHLDDEEKREAIGVLAQLQPRQFVLGDLMFFEGTDPSEPECNPEVDDPSTVGTLVSILTDCGFVITDVARVTDQAGVITARMAQLS